MMRMGWRFLANDLPMQNEKFFGLYQITDILEFEVFPLPVKAEPFIASLQIEPYEESLLRVSDRLLNETSWYI